MKINYGLIAYLPYQDKDGNIDILHFCGYEQKPSTYDIESLREEFKNDKEFGLTEISDDIIIQLATESILEYYKRQINTHEQV
jgi:hypothetical protein